VPNFSNREEKGLQGSLKLGSETTLLIVDQKKAFEQRVVLYAKW